MASKAATLGDPRRPAEIVKYVRSTAKDEGPHLLGMLSLMMAMASMAIKVKAVGWTAIFVSLCAIMHIPPSHADFKQALSSTMLSLVGLGATYLMPMPGRTAPAPSPAATG